MTKMNVLLLALLLTVTTLLIYNYNIGRPASQARIDACNKEVSELPETTEAEINQAINRFTDCLQD